ncbi:MAG TPA: hypothetical protein VMT46_03300 [Anaerolineaceae bacterium]|nr:hypothetical protein [Anaerolineaceae bacterium]
MTKKLSVKGKAATETEPKETEQMIHPKELKAEEIRDYTHEILKKLSSLPHSRGRRSLWGAEVPGRLSATPICDLLNFVIPYFNAALRLRRISQ